MPPKARAQCQICAAAESKYACPTCDVPYCSVACCKDHKRGECSERPTNESGLPSRPSGELGTAVDASSTTDLDISGSLPLRPLTSLRWPRIPSPPAYDPLAKNDPKPLQLPQYEAIATSPSIRQALTGNRLPEMLRRIDALPGTERETTLQRLLSVVEPKGSSAGQMGGDHSNIEKQFDENDKKGFMELVGLIEAAARSTEQSSVGLDWESSRLDGQ